MRSLPIPERAERAQEGFLRRPSGHRGRRCPDSETSIPRRADSDGEARGSAWGGNDARLHAGSWRERDNWLALC